MLRRCGMRKIIEFFFARALAGHMAAPYLLFEGKMFVLSLLRLCQ